MKPKLGRRKGFSVQLQKIHWFTVGMGYDYLKHHGQTTPEMDEAAATLFDKLPDIRPEMKNIRSVIAGGHEREDYDRWRGSKTVRFRADQIEGAVQLLRAGAYLMPHGQASTTIFSRAHDLASVDELDLLADAGR